MKKAIYLLASILCYCCTYFRPQNKTFIANHIWPSRWFDG